jgi:hypothetical protein
LNIGIFLVLVIWFLGFGSWDFILELKIQKAVPQETAFNYVNAMPHYFLARNSFTLSL